MISIGRDMRAGLTYRLGATSVLISQTANVWIFGGNPDETISARAWREGQLMGCPVWKARRKRIDKFFARFGDFDHCRKSHEKDLVFADMVGAYRFTKGGRDGSRLVDT